MDETQVEIKEELVYDEEECVFDVDPSCDIKEESLDDEDIKIEVYPEPKYEVVEEELVNYDLLEPSVYHIISDSSDRVTVVPVSPQSASASNKSKRSSRDSDEYVRTYSKQPPQPKKMVQCKICKAKFFSSHTLLLHEKTHSENAVFTCDKCEQVFPSLGPLMEHQRQKKHFKATDSYQDKVKSLHKKKFKCKSCGLVFFSEKTFRFHVKIHAGLMKYSCNVCEQMFSTLSDLAFHREKLGHGLKCQECGTVCATVQEMDQHHKMHTKWKFYKCADCNFSTVVQKHLRKHKASSCPGVGKEVLTPVMCSSCSTVFENKDIYEKHTCPVTENVESEDAIFVDTSEITIFDNETKIEIEEVEIDEL